MKWRPKPVKLDNITQFIAFVILLQLAFTLVLCVIGSFPNSISHFKWLMYDDVIDYDSWWPMGLALTHVRNFPEELIYQTLLFGEGIKFQYPPTSLLILDLPMKMGIGHHHVIMILDMLSRVSVFLVAIFSSKILTLVLTQNNFRELGTAYSSNQLQQHMLIVLLTILFYPLVWSYHVGQIQTILTLLATLSLFFWLKDQKALSGIMLGLFCLVKPQLALVFVWAMIRRQWNMVIAGAITTASALCISIAVFGFDNHLDYLSALSFLSRHGESYYPNQSINGLMNRLLFNGNNLEWEQHGFPDLLYPVYITTLISSIALILLGLFWRWKSKRPSEIDLSIMLLCTTMASPIAWEHHYAILIPIFVLLIPHVCYHYRRVPAKLVLFGVSFAIASQFLSVLNYWVHDTYFNFLQSYLFFAAVIILGFMFAVSRKRLPLGKDLA